MVQFGLTITEARDGLDGQGKPEVVNGLPGAIQLVEDRHEFAKKWPDLLPTGFGAAGYPIEMCGIIPVSLVTSYIEGDWFPLLHCFPMQQWFRHASGQGCDTLLPILR